MTVRQFIIGFLTLRGWFGAGAKPVDQAQACWRATVCHQCHRHGAPWSSWRKWLSRTLVFYFRLRGQPLTETHLSKRLRGCGVCGCMCRILVHVPLGKIVMFKSVQEMSAYPESCWIKKELYEE